MEKKLRLYELSRESNLSGKIIGFHCQIYDSEDVEARYQRENRSFFAKNLEGLAKKMLDAGFPLNLGTRGVVEKLEKRVEIKKSRVLTPVDGEEIGTFYAIYNTLSEPFVREFESRLVSCEPNSQLNQNEPL